MTCLLKKSKMSEVENNKEPVAPNKVTEVYNNIQQVLKETFPIIVYPSEQQKIENKKYRLYVHKPINKDKDLEISGLPVSLMYQTLAKFSNLKEELQVCFTNKELQSPTNQLPFLLTPEDKALVENDIINLFETDLKVKIKDNLEMKSLLHRILDDFGTTVNFFLFCDQQLYDMVTYPYLAQDYSWPLNYVMAYKIQHQKIQELLNVKNTLNKEDVLFQFEKSCKMFDDLLKEQQYLSGVDEPNFVDAALFSHIHIILDTFPKKHALKSLIMEFKNLTQHTKHIFNLYFKK